MALLPVLLLLLSLSPPSPCASSSLPPLHALDGFGRPVAWWVVLKLPMLVQNDSASSSLRPTPCDCAPPDCSNVLSTPRSGHDDRAAGLCYLYADAHTPALRHFRELGYDCLGQGGNDPVSHTLRQREARPGAYWALFNDQLNGIARPFKAERDAQSEPKNATTCGGGDAFSAHAKGAVALDASLGGGFYLQASTPGFPDPSRPRTTQHNSDSTRESDAFVRLGCQRDNNVKFAQHFAAFSLEEPAVETLAGALGVARLCSGNFYRGELGRSLASDTLWRDGAAEGASGAVAALFHALLDLNSTDGGWRQDGERDATDDLIRHVKLPLRQPMQPARRESRVSTSVFAPLPRSEKLLLPEINDNLARQAAAASLPVDDPRGSHLSVDDSDGRTYTSISDEDLEVEVLVKGPRAAVPPWTLLAASLESDVSVASWWDDGYGIPTICAGDAFALTPHQFCLEEPRAGATLLPPDGQARFNIENLVQATWKMRDGSDNLTWHLVGGGRARDGNHGAFHAISTPSAALHFDWALLWTLQAKWGVATPRNDHGTSWEDQAFVTVADLNMEGFPCSKACNGSQAGRGGSFFSLRQPELHHSLTQSLITKACRCVPPPALRLQAEKHQGGADPEVRAFEALRMCHHGCIKKFEERWRGADLPTLSANASSFWAD